MHREISKALIQQNHDQGDTLEKTDRIYKPTYTIEFNRKGEALLYSCEPMKHMQVYLKYPYVFYESLIPLSLFTLYVNPFNLEWYWNYLSLVYASVGMLLSSSLVAKSRILGQFQVQAKKSVAFTRWKGLEI